MSTKKRTTHPSDSVTRNLHDYIVNAARELKSEAINHRRYATLQGQTADRYYDTLKKIADIFGVQYWTVSNLPSKLRKLKLPR